MKGCSGTTKNMKPSDFSHPDEYLKAFNDAYPGFVATYFSGIIGDWKVVRESEKAVMTHDSDYNGAWFPKSQIVVEDGKIVGIKRAWYKRIRTTSQRGC